MIEFILFLVTKSIVSILYYMGKKYILPWGALMCSFATAMRLMYINIHYIIVLDNFNNLKKNKYLHGV